MQLLNQMEDIENSLKNFIGKTMNDIEFELVTGAGLVKSRRC